jgi:hypothetical protein
VPTFGKTMNTYSSKVNKTYFYLKNKYGVDLFKAWIKSPDQHPAIVAFANKRTMFLWNVLTLRKLYGMQ